MIADRVRMRKSKKGIPSYMILTNGTRIDFELENTPIANFINYNSFIVINGVSYTNSTIEEIQLGESYSGVTEIGSGFLYGRSSLINVTLNFPVLKSVSGHFLYDCSSLTSVTLNFPVLKSVDYYFMASCSSLIDVTLDFPALSSMGDILLYGCTSLTDLTLTTQTPPITGGSGFLYDTPNLSSIDVPANSINLYKTTYPWSSKSSLFKSKQSYIILTDDTIIGFKNENTPIANLCTSDSSMVINGISYTKSAIKGIHFKSSYNGVTEIGNYFLQNCSSLIDVTLDFPSLESVGSGFLSYCESLIDVTLTAETPPITNSQYFLYETPNLSLIHVPIDAAEAYKTTYPWSSKSSLINFKPSYMILTDGRRIDFEIDNTPFADLSSYSFYLTINGVSYGRDTFKEIHLGTSYSRVTEIGTGFLANCTSLTNVTMDFPALNSIGNGFLSYCGSLTNVTLNFPALNSVGNSFLVACSSLTNLTMDFPALNSVANHFLYACESLTNITMDFPALNSVDSYFLYACTSLTILIVTAETPPTLAGFSSYFLDMTPNLSSIYVPANSVNLYKTTYPWSSKSSIIKAI